MLFQENDVKLVSPIKWAGGKSFLINKVRQTFLDNNDKEWFVEVFAGSLALTLYYKPRKVLINDICFPLINMWEMIKDNCEELCDLLDELSKDKYNNREKFDEIKEEFNGMKDRELVLEERIRLAGYFIYMNKRSFNGLYRENSSGKYNVPYRHYKTGVIYERENIRVISDYFNNNEVIFSNVSFMDVEISENSFIYLDPPYYPCGTSGFTQYNKEGFSKGKHEDLRNKCVEWVAEGNNILESNSPCEEIEELYENFNNESFCIKRSMRSAISGRVDEENGENNEILIWS